MQDKVTFYVNKPFDEVLRVEERATHGIHTM